MDITTYRSWISHMDDRGTQLMTTQSTNGGECLSHANTQERMEGKLVEMEGSLDLHFEGTKC
jgi:hypothetical protein